MKFYLQQRKWGAIIALLAFTISCSEPSSEKIHSNNAPSSNTPTQTTVSTHPKKYNINESQLEIYKQASCGCCKDWITHLNDFGFNTHSQDLDNLSELKSKHRIKGRYQSCHTAVSKEGYIFEGHIPAKFIQQFLQEPPKDALGLAVPSMPVGSPGMEMGDRFMPYAVLVLKKDGGYEVYAEITSPEEQY